MSAVSQQITEVDGCQPDKIPADVLCSPQPLVLRGLVDSWPMVQSALVSAKRAVGYLKKFSTDEPVTVYRGAAEIEGRVFYNDDLNGFNFEAHRLPLAEMASELLHNIDQPKAPMLYVGSTMIDKWLPGFRTENDIVFDDYDPLVSLWLGNQSRIAAHYDFASNIACVAGREGLPCFLRSNWKICMWGHWILPQLVSQSAWWTLPTLTLSASQSLVKP